MIKNKYPTTKPSLNLDFANTKSLDPRITFRRGTPGTYYDGVTHVKAEENLLSYSEDFSEWESLVRLELTANETAPDGSSTAYKIAQASGETNAGGASKLVNMNKGENYTYSIYAKAGTNRDYLTVRIYDYSISDHYQYFLFDLGNGQTLDNGIKRSDYYGGTHDIQDVGNGWYRCIVSFPVVNDSSSGFLISNFLLDTPASSTVAVADDGGFIYLWGAQLEQRDTVTAYTTTMREDGTSAPITKYQPKLMTAAADRARFDHDPITGESKGLLIEEQRTNLLTYSNSTSDWSDVGAPIKIADAAVAPDGTQAAMEVIDNNTSSPCLIYMESVGISTIATYSASLYVKQLSSPDCTFNVYTAGESESNLTFTFATETVDATGDNLVSSSATDVGNGWYRLVIVFNSLSSGANIRFRLWPRSRDNSTITGSLLVWGAQLEAGSFATSYIKTTGASATRSADNASITGENFSSWYRQDEGSFYSEISTFDYGNGLSRITISDGTNNNRILMANSLSYLLLTDSAGTRSVNRIGPVADGNYHKKSYGFKKDDFSVCYDGSLSLDSIDGEMPLKVDAIYFHDPAGSDDYINGHIKKLAYYPQRLTNEQLQNLTK